MFARGRSLVVHEIDVMFSGRFPGRVECDCFHVLFIMRGVDVTLLGKCFNLNFDQSDQIDLRCSHQFILWLPFLAKDVWKNSRAEPTSAYVDLHELSAWNFADLSSLKGDLYVC